MKLTQDRPRTAQYNKLSGKVALVTGGSRGIGAAIARRLADEGATVAITYEKSAVAAEEVVASINSTGAKAIAIKSDVSNPIEARKLIEEVRQTVGKIDILVNNAGVWDGGSIDQIDVAQYDRIFDVNVKGVLANTIAALPLIPDGGRIINISSGASTLSLPGLSIYSASKAALDALTRIWAQDLGGRKITVNGVAPGTTATDMFHKAIPSENQQAMAEKTALGRIGLPDDIAAVVAFLASDDAGWITGQTIRTDGGINI
jgi:3-oxoacyl-[acyl-carrier protein] reductase